MLNFFVLNNEITRKHWKKISKDKNDASVPHLEIADVILGHLMFLTLIINEIKKFGMPLFQINYLLKY